jgi:hypothetical protein
MELDKNCKDRDYLFGRLWAVAEEGVEEKYNNSVTLGNHYKSFQEYPAEEWKRIVIDSKFRFLMSGKYGIIITEIVALFEHDDFIRKEKLGDAEFLAGYMCQKAAGIKDPSAVELGRKGGAVTSPTKAEASRQNGKKGGRPSSSAKEMENE